MQSAPFRGSGGMLPQEKFKGQFLVGLGTALKVGGQDASPPIYNGARLSTCVHTGNVCEYTKVINC